jgi:spoIIIJ-associated protein
MPAQPWNLDKIIDAVDEFLDGVLETAGLDLDYEIREGGGDSAELITPDLTVDFSGDDVPVLLERHGELLLALEHLTLEALKISHTDRYRLLFDANDYRMMRIDELRLSAVAAAEKVAKTGQPFHFQPMTSRERRILHLALRGNTDVTSTSEGLAPRRHTVVSKAEKS